MTSLLHFTAIDWTFGLALRFGTVPAWSTVPEDAEKDDVETSVGREERGGPEDLRQEPLEVVVLLPPPENRSNLQHDSRSTPSFPSRSPGAPPRSAST